jgi:uncharacterized protein
VPIHLRGAVAFPSQPAGTGTIALLLVLALAVSSGFALALDVPPLTGRIVDTAHLLPPDLAASLSQELAAHEQRTGNQVVILTVPTLQGEPLEEFSHRVATTWKLGQKGTDNGVLLLVAPQDRRLRIEVGYGLEGVLTDAVTSRIIRNEMVPHFRAGNYAAGIAAGARAIIGTIEGTYAVPKDQPPGPSTISHQWSGILPAILVGAFVGAIFFGLKRALGLFAGGILAFLLALSSGILIAVIAAAVALVLALVLSVLFRGGGGIPGGGYSSSGWSGGGMGDFSGGGSFTGGGGDFGGGGASGRW